MLGNLFSQRKTVIEPSVAQQSGQSFQTQQAAPAATPFVPQQQSETNVVLGSKMNPTLRQNLTALSHLDQRTTQVLSNAQNEATRLHKQFIDPEQLLYGLLFDEQIFQIFEKSGANPAKLSTDLQAQEKQEQFTGQPTLSDRSLAIFDRAFQDVKQQEETFIMPEDLLVALNKVDNKVSAFLQAEGVKKEQLEQNIVSPTGAKAKGKSVLAKYGVDLTEQAKEGKLDPVAGREKEIERLIHILLRRTKNNPIIIGEAGVGKTAIVEGLAQEIVSGKAPKDMAQKRIIQLDIASLVAGASHRGEFEERLKDVINEALASNGQIILFIDEIHTIIGTGESDSALDASNIIKPYLARGQLQIIGTTTTAEYRKYFEKDKAFERRFQSVTAEEPDEDTALKMLQVLKPKYEAFHNVTMSDDTLKDAVHLSKKYIGERYLPDKAVDVLDEAGAEVKLQHAQGEHVDTAVSKNDIEKIISSWTGIPITKLTENESEKLLHLDKLIHERLIDQEEAVMAVSEAVRRGRVGLSSANRPIASFVFLGPTGVGKTELAKTLAELLFGREDLMVRLDMSEYMEKHEVAKLIGAPPGYVGYEEGGQLTEAVRIKPYSIVLLDEVEKAHPDVFNILLQILEDGRLTDNKGNTISFKNTIIIATSNIGSSLIQQQLSDDQHPEQDFNKKFAELTNQLVDELHKFFKPELLNRFDEVVVFKPLRMQDMNQIAKLGIKKTEKLLKEQGYSLEITEPAVTQLAKEGYDPVYGARPLRRLIQTAIENPIALALISKQFVPGDAILINFDESKNAFTFTKTTPKPDEATKDQAGTDQATSDHVQESGNTDQVVASQMEQPPTSAPADVVQSPPIIQTSEQQQSVVPQQSSDGTQMAPQPGGSELPQPPSLTTTLPQQPTAETTPQA